MKPKKSKNELKSPVEQEVYQAGWRVDKRDMHIFHGISKWAEENRYSRNIAITIAIEFFLKAQEQKTFNQPKQ
jgi:hypothetical protein